MYIPDSRNSAIPIINKLYPESGQGADFSVKSQIFISYWVKNSISKDQFLS